MALDSRHPSYTECVADWRQMRDTYAGERAVKDAGTLYLPATSGMVADGFPAGTAGAGSTATKGYRDYIAYRTRARCPDLVDEAVSALLGVMHSKPPTIELPPAMEYLRAQASSRGESLETLLKRINFEQMVVGRVGLLGDVLDVGERKGEFYIATYVAESIVNWDTAVQTEIEVESLNMLVLDETGVQRVPEQFEWETVQQYRVLVLGEFDEPNPVAYSRGGPTYRAGVFRKDTQYAEGKLKAPKTKGRAAHEIPFVFINAEDIDAPPGKPPLLGLSNLTLTIYRGEADYRQSLFMQGQDTLVILGLPAEDAAGGGTGGASGGQTRVGVGAVINLPDPGGDAKFIGVNSEGLSEQRTALQNDYSRGEQFAGRLMDSVTRERESGDALRIRLATRTATLNQIALAGAYGLETLLRKLARWMGADPQAVKVTPNMDFVDDQMSGEQLRLLMEAKRNGAPLSIQTVHRLMSQRSMTDLSFEQEIAVIKGETALAEELIRAGGGPDPNTSQSTPTPTGSGGGNGGSAAE